MAEREQSLHPPTAEAEATESIDVRRLPHLISAARQSSGADQRALAHQINRVLVAMRGPGHAEEESRVIVLALDEHAFDGLVDDAGRSCRKEAVESLLACGFPHALKISHEDLVFARSYRPADTDEGEPGWKQSMRRSRRTGAAIVLGGELLFLMILLSTAPALIIQPGGVIALLSGFTAALLSVLFALSPPKLEGQVGWGTVLGLCALLQLLTATSVGSPALLGGVGIVFGLLVALSSQYEPRADPPKPGDWDYRNPNGL